MPDFLGILPHCQILIKNIKDIKDYEGGKFIVIAVYPVSARR